MGSITERVEHLRRLLDLTQKDFAAVMGITQSHYGQILRGRNRVSVDHIEKLIIDKRVNASPLWLFTGTEPVFSIIDDKNKERLREVMEPIVSYGVKRPSMDQIENLYNYVLDKSGEKLSPEQQLKLKLACFRCYVDNPKLNTLEELAIAANIYLKFILQFPDIEI